MAFSNKDSIRNRLTSKKHSNTDSGVYMLTCKKDSCQEIYVGQSKDITLRFSQYAKAKTCASMRPKYTSVNHTRGQHDLVPANGLRPYMSTSLSHRLVIETCFITLCRTTKGNKASSSIRDMNTLGPIILRAAPIDWKVVSKAQPSLNPDIVPRKYRPFFSINASSSDNDALEPFTQSRYYLRSSASRPPEVALETNVRTAPR